MFWSSKPAPTAPRTPSNASGPARARETTAAVSRPSGAVQVRPPSAASASAGPAKRDSAVERVLAKAGQLPPLPHVAKKILSMTADLAQTDAQALTTVLSTDQALAAQILKAANSAFYALNREVTNVRQACTLLGFAKIRSMAVAFLADGVFTSAGQLGKQLWEHGLGTAVFARVIAEEVARPEAEDAFIGGLLHDVGKTLLLKADREAFQLAMIESGDDAPMRLEAEKENFGTDHTQLGTFLAQKWGFPKKLIRAIQTHHFVGPPHLETKFEAVIALANQAAHRYGIGCPETYGINLFGLPSFSMLGLTDKQLQHCCDRFEEEHKRMLDLISVSRSR
jgi:putative nucleotidyltransferase with HDIG domain